MRHRSLSSTLFALCFFCATRAYAQADFAGVRSVGMGGAQRALGGSNDALLVNPAAMALGQRYSTQLAFVTGVDGMHRLMASTVDSKTGMVAAGLSYMRSWGDKDGSHPGNSEVHYGFAAAPWRPLIFGVSGQNVTGHLEGDAGRKRTTLFNGSAGLVLHLAQTLSVGVAWENFATRKPNPFFRQALSFAAGLSLPMMRVAVDMRLFPVGHGPFRRELSAGGEAMIARVVALRGGYRLSLRPVDAERATDQWVTAGVGFALGPLLLEAGMEKSVSTAYWRMATGLQWLM